MSENEIKNSQVHSNIDRIAPKYCNVMQAALLENGNIVITMLYNEAVGSKNESANAVLIERIVIDIEHAKKLAGILQEAVKRHSEEQKP